MNPTETLEKIRTELVRKHGLAENSLTEHQLAKVIRDALASGDIQRHVRFGGISQSQMVTYLPYFGVESLRAENARLKQKISELEARLNG